MQVKPMDNPHKDGNCIIISKIQDPKLRAKLQLIDKDGDDDIDAEEVYRLKKLEQMYKKAAYFLFIVSIVLTVVIFLVSWGAAEVSKEFHSETSANTDTDTGSRRRRILTATSASNAEDYEYAFLGINGEPLVAGELNNARVRVSGNHWFQELGRKTIDDMRRRLSTGAAAAEVMPDFDLDDIIKATCEVPTYAAEFSCPHLVNTAGSMGHGTPDTIDTSFMLTPDKRYIYDLSPYGYDAFMFWYISDLCGIPAGFFVWVDENYNGEWVYLYWANGYEDDPEHAYFGYNYYTDEPGEYLPVDLEGQCFLELNIRNVKSLAALQLYSEYMRSEYSSVSDSQDYDGTASPSAAPTQGAYWVGHGICSDENLVLPERCYRDVSRQNDHEHDCYMDCLNTTGCTHFSFKHYDFEKEEVGSCVLSPVAATDCGSEFSSAGTGSGPIGGVSNGCNGCEEYECWATPAYAGDFTINSTESAWDDVDFLYQRGMCSSDNGLTDRCASDNSNYTISECDSLCYATSTCTHFAFNNQTNDCVMMPLNSTDCPTDFSFYSGDSGVDGTADTFGSITHGNDQCYSDGFNCGEFECYQYSTFVGYGRCTDSDGWETDRCSEYVYDFHECQSLCENTASCTHVSWADREKACVMHGIAEYECMNGVYITGDTSSAVSSSSTDCSWCDVFQCIYIKESTATTTTSSATSTTVQIAEL